jgi:hypothetical protein
VLQIWHTQKEFLIYIHIPQRFHSMGAFRLAMSSVCAEKHPRFAAAPWRARPTRAKTHQNKGASMTSLAFDGMRKKPFLVAAALTATLLLVGCYTPGERAAGGAVIGGLGGAAVGTLATGGLAGPVLAYSALGAATGAVIGAATAPVRRYYYARGCVRHHRRYC